MEDFDIDSLEIDPTNNIVCVASVSFDRQRNEFKFSEGFKQQFGANSDAMMQKQG